jgi:hypothetical protein
MASSSTAPNPAPPTLAELAAQLRDGPLKCLAALQDHTAALAGREPTSDREMLQHLQTLVGLAHCGMSRFHEFTEELRMLVDHMAARSAERH